VHFIIDLFYRYYLYKREHPIYQPDADNNQAQYQFPFEASNAMQTCLKHLRPQLVPFSTLKDANEAVNKLTDMYRQKVIRIYGLV
jgi:hypothetical protein